jgi:hypothetical protein
MSKRTRQAIGDSILSSASNTTSGGLNSTDGATNDTCSAVKGACNSLRDGLNGILSTQEITVQGALSLLDDIMKLTLGS